MSGTTWSKFFWADWESDEKLKLCSPGAQALWMRMLCVCAKEGGYLVVEGHKLGPAEMAVLTGWPAADVKRWWGELERWGVFSVEGRGKVYCRRMVRDTKRAQTARENGKNGGNPSLRKNNTSRASDNQTPTDSPTDAPGIKPRAISQRRKRDANASLSPSGDASPSNEPKYPEPFEAAWKAYPHVRGRSSKPKALGFWRRIPQAHRAALPSAAARYARDGREPKADCGAPGMHLWLRDAKYEDWLTESPGAEASPLSRWPGPPDMRAAVVAATSEEFARSYLDPCGWRNGPDRVVTSSNSIRITELRKGAQEVLERFGARAVVERPH